jgi:LydA holin phage, holin superfamily III
MERGTMWAQLGSFKREIEAIVLAFVAGLLGYCMRTIKAGRKVRVAYAILEATSSALVGYLVFLLCKATHVGEDWTGPIVGVCGWIGASGTIRLLEKTVFTKLGVKTPEEVDDGMAAGSTGTADAAGSTDDASTAHETK